MHFKYLLSVLSICFANLVLAQSTNVSFQRTIISLAGNWHTSLGNVTLPGTIDESKLTPRTKDTLQTGQLTRLHPFVGKIKYKKEITIPAEWQHKNWRLILERTKATTVWMDKDSIGHSNLILSPQQYNLGKLSAGKHTITIEVDNGETAVPKNIHGSHAWSDATQTNWNGIIGKIALEAHDGVLIEDAQFYPSAQANTIPVSLNIKSELSVNATIIIKGNTHNTTKRLIVPQQEITIQLQKGVAKYDFNFSIGDDKALWSEFDPALYKIELQLITSAGSDRVIANIGIRDFSTSGTQFSINNLKTVLRGKHDACVFPLTGYPPMDKVIWKQQFQLAKQFGINHYRFHSWTPPQAAFDAADEEGIYMQPELPYWGGMDKDSTALNNFLLQEGNHILKTYGNHPSFVMMALGNELGGDQKFMRTFTDYFKTIDKRHLYAFGANNWLGTGGQQAGEDFLITCRVGGEVGTADYSTHTRSTFSFADAKYGGLLNAQYPSTLHDFSKAVERSSVPVISHENGQFQVYPDYDEIKKYTGVLYPYNLEIFRKRLQENNLQDQAVNFHKATTAFAVACYKADIEMCLRTPGFGGYQILDLQDYPGQGSAYVGILNAFMEPKANIDAGVFAGFNAAVVPLAIMPKYCWYNTEAFTATIKLFNYSAASINEQMLDWKILDKNLNTVIAKGSMNVNSKQGSLAQIGVINESFNALTSATQLSLQLRFAGKTNQYDIWVYPNQQSKLTGIVQTNSLTTAIQQLQKGKKVLFIPLHKDVEQQSVGGMFTPDYWNYAMFKNISEWLKRDVSPGTVSILTNPEHPLFKTFPTQMHSNWQWWTILKNARALILNKTAADYKPLIQVIDNIERNHKLGLVFEMQVGKGKLLVSMCDLERIRDTPEGNAFKNAIYNYMQSDDFAPATQFTPAALKAIFQTSEVSKDIKGVKNITSYE